MLPVRSSLCGCDGHQVASWKAAAPVDASKRPWNRVDRPQWLKQVECAKQWRQCTLPSVTYIAIRCIAISNYHRNHLRSFVQACSTQFNAQLMAVFQVSISCTTESTGENNTESVHQKRPQKGSTKRVHKKRPVLLIKISTV